MNEPISSVSESPSAFGISPRQLLAIGFRHLGLIALTFVALFAVIVLAIFLQPDAYRSEMKILVKHERVDPLVTSEGSQEQRWQNQGVTEEDLNSEVELLRSRDLLERVVVAAGLHQGTETSWMTALRERVVGPPPGSGDDTLRIAGAALVLGDALSVGPIQKTSLISVTYASPNPQTSVSVLRTLADLYLDKHLAVHRPAGALDFFEQETGRYRAQLDEVKVRLANFGRAEGVVSAPSERDAALRQIEEVSQGLSETRAQAAAAQERIRVLETQLVTTPERVSTDIREASSRLQELQRSRLLELELRRIELLRQFQPSYPPVVEVEQQLQATREAIALAEQSPILEQATDRNPTHEWITTELARARSELGGLNAREIALRGSLSRYREEAEMLENLTLEHHDLDRDLKVAEENYLTYYRRLEEARISDALDTRRIVNVAVAESPTLPIRPTRPRRLLLLLLAGMVAAIGSLGLAFAVDFLDPSFRTPDEVNTILKVPVLAAFGENRAWQPAMSNR